MAAVLVPYTPESALKALFAVCYQQYLSGFGILSIGW